MNIKEIALKIWPEVCKSSSVGETIAVKFAEALIAEVHRQNKPMADFIGYAALGTGQYLLNACPATDELPAELVISVATEEEKIGRVIGDLRDVEPGTEIQPEQIAVRLAFFNVAGLDALEQQLRILREESFPDTFQPSIEAEREKVAEACAKSSERLICDTHACGTPERRAWNEGTICVATAIRNGKWRRFVK